MIEHFTIISPAQRPKNTDFNTKIKYMIIKINIWFIFVIIIIIYDILQAVGENFDITYIYYSQIPLAGHNGLEKMFPNRSGDELKKFSTWEDVFSRCLEVHIFTPWCPLRSNRRVVIQTRTRSYVESDHHTELKHFVHNIFKKF